MKSLNLNEQVVEPNPSQPPLAPARGMLAGTPQPCCDPASNRGGAELALPLSRGSWRGFSSPRYLATITTIAATLFACLPIANADTLGRLFFTPAQRQQLDFSHTRNATADGNSAAVFTVNGIVQKNGGARTVWVNGISQSVEHNGERTPTAQTVTVPGKARPVRLKVGEKILLDQPASQDEQNQ